MNKVFSFFKLISLYIILFLLIFPINSQETELKTFSSMLYPTILTLNDESLVMVSSDGIHFFDSDLNENVVKKINYDNQIQSKTEHEKTTMAQFPEDQGEYIMIIVKNLLYFFEEDGTKIKDIDLSNYSINASHYSLIPYKKEGNYLHYIIAYPLGDKKSFNLIHFKFDLVNQLNEISKSKEIETINMRDNSQTTPSNFLGVSCIFMAPMDLGKDILVCFYLVTYPPQIQTRSFDHTNNEDFVEYTQYFKYYTPSDTQFSSFISAITDEDKQKALIFYENGNAYVLTFDFENYILDKDINIRGGFILEYSKNKLFYYKRTKQFFIISGLYNVLCKVYIMCFDSEFNFISHGLVNPDTGCSNSESFSAFFNKGDLSIVVDNSNFNKIVIKQVAELETIQQNDDDTTINESTETSNNDIINNKCKSSTSESLFYNLCIECNTDKNYYPAEIKDNSLFHGFVECYNETTKPINFYFNSSTKKYKICYETCLTCNEDGNELNNNCLTCANNHIKTPNNPNSKNCVTKCLYPYYYTFYGQYKCSNSSNCPEEANLYISELNKCTYDCSKEVKYKYQYDGRCLENCPEKTKPNSDNICIENNIEYCSKSETEIVLKDFLTSGGVDANAKNYAKEFIYTDKHISHFYNNHYSIILYKDLNCIEELSINMPKIDFGECYTKVQQSISPINQKVIIGLIEKLKGSKQSTITYFFYHPITGEKLKVDTLCKDEEVIIKESILSQLNTSAVDLNSVLFLTKQDINIFDLSDDFYTDICYQYESPNGKDIPVKERIHIYYPNMTLCESGCTTKGINLTSMESICLCYFSAILNNEYVESNALIENSIQEVTDIFSNSNLDVLKCFKDVFKIELIKKGIGGFIIITIFIFEIIFSMIFLFYNMDQIRNYIYDISEQYIKLIGKQNTNMKLRNDVIIKNHIVKIQEPPKKKKIKHKNNNNLRAEIKYNIRNNNSLTSKEYLKKGKLISNNFGIFRNETINPSFKENHIFILKNNRNHNHNKNNEKNENIINMDEYLKTDLDDMDYEDALKNDKRSFCNLFADKIKIKLMIVDTFFNKDNIRPISIKVLLVLLDIDLYFVINGLFYSEEYIIELYHLEEEDSFFSYIPRSINRFIYATTVSAIVGMIIDCIFIEEKKIKHILTREKDDIFQLRYEIAVISKKIKKRYIIFILVCYCIAIISWYYVSCFNNVYKGVKIEWIKSSITIIIIMQLLSILIVFLDAILREISFKCKSERIYKLRQLLS